MQVAVFPGDTVGAICARFGLSRSAFFEQNPALKPFSLDGIWTAELFSGELVEVGEVFAEQPGVGAPPATILCAVDAGQGGWSRGPDNRWYYAHHEGATLSALAKRYLGNAGRLDEIYQGTRQRGLLPPGSTKDNIPVMVGGQRTRFWMPDDGIQRAFEMKCIPDVGRLGDAPAVPTGTLVYCTVDVGQGGWRKAPDGRWYYAHHQDLILSALAQRYLGDGNKWKLIYEPSQARGMLPPGSTPDDIAIYNGADRTLFYMPDEAILNAYTTGCIPDTGNVAAPSNIPPKPDASYCSEFGPDWKVAWSDKDKQWGCVGPCRPDEIMNEDGTLCLCPPGTHRADPTRNDSPCVPDKVEPKPCPAGMIRKTANGPCELQKPTKSCPDGMVMKNGECVQKPVTCPAGTVPDGHGGCRSSSGSGDKPTSSSSGSNNGLLAFGAALVLGGIIVAVSSSDTPKAPPKPAKGSKNEKDERRPAAR